MTSSDDLIRRLAGFGLHEAEARVFFHLTRLHRAKAAEVARAAAVRRPDVYPLLESLMDKGLVEQTVERPALFVAVPVADALARLVDRDRRRVAQLADEADALCVEWPQVRSDVPPADSLAVHQGLAQVSTILEERTRGATRELLVALSAGLLQRLDGLRDILAERAAAGCRVRVLTAIEDAAGARLLQGVRDDASVRHVALPSHFEVVVVDGAETLQFVSAGRSESTHGAEETLLWLRSADVALAHGGVFDRLWSEGLDLRERVKEFEGDAAPRLAVLRGRWVRLTRMREMIARAGHRIDCYVEARELAAWDEHGLLDWLDQRAQEGLTVSIHCHGEPPEGTRVLPLDEPPPGSAVVIDAAEAVVAFGTRPRAPATDQREWAVWGNHPGLVALLQASTPLPRTKALS